jgi:hypothetical protein
MAGLALIIAAFLWETVLEQRTSGRWVGIGLVIAGCALLLLAFLPRRLGHLALLRISVATLATLFSIAALELFFRLVGYDFARHGLPGTELPIYYHSPATHAGEGIFRRSGPATWHGKPLTAFMRIRWGMDDAYPEETPVQIDYDSLGFRNPPGLTDWEVVVTGDSFVELGYLPYDSLFTTIAARKLGVRIKNLGLSTTGPISQTFFVKKYGRAPSTKDAVLCFFEGNDLEDLSREERQTEFFRSTGRPWTHPKQCSLLGAVIERICVPQTPDRPGPGLRPNAVLLTATNRLMTLFGTPPSWKGLGSKRRERVERALEEWSRTVRHLGMRPWVMYLPDSRRVFDGLFRYTIPDPRPARPLDDFAGPLRAVCTSHGIGFIDPYPALRRAAESGRVPHNLLGDTHLTREGATVVADVLADSLAPHHAR